MKQKQTTTTLPKTINTGMDVWEFFNYLHNVEGVNFHPEIDFNDYCQGETDKPTYTPEEAKKRNELMDICFNVCSDSGIDIFTIGLEAMRLNLGLDDYSKNKPHTNVAVCLKTEEYVNEDTGELIGFYRNKFYEIEKVDSIWIHVSYRKYHESLMYPKWEFDKRFRYAEDWETEGFNEKLWDSL